MSYKLEKPYTENQRLDFIVEYSHRQSLLIEETPTALYALEPNEIMVDGVPQIDTQYEAKQAAIREANFKNQFFKVDTITDIFEGGWYRKQPKGYSSATESINTAFNIVTTMGVLPAGTLIFYREPDFTKPEQCTEDWLTQNQIKNNALSAEDFKKLYYNFALAWNSQEHL